ncbi:MAG TPA: phage tail protein [Bryobacteraceae bacterium]|nr:phage tail protein [Bryobacteraceae bacterium]
MSTTPTIFNLKEQAVTDTPLLLFDCTLANGQTDSWCTHGVTVGATTYAARVLQQNVFEMQTASQQGVDGIPKISLVLANADSHFSEIEQQTGWKGATLTVSFLFYDLPNNAPATDASVIFQGICNPPDEIRQATFRITATNVMNLQRLLMPEVRIQRMCPWDFPATEAQRVEAIDGGASGQYSQFYPCGYSAGETGGTGNLNSGVPFTACGYTRSDCQARGMWSNFGGIEFVPPAISVRSYGAGSNTTSAVSVNAAEYNDFVPMVYGTVWYNPPVVFARNDGNLTRMEVLLGIGQMQGVITVLVNDVAIPLGVAGTNMTGTGWYNVITLGTRTGAFDMNFTDATGQPAGDPYGSMAYLSVVVPTALNNGTSLPEVQVLAQGLILPTYASDGTETEAQFTNNPAWILLDLLRRMGWSTSEIDIASFAAAAAYCDEQINTLDLNSNPITLARFQCNFALQKARSAGDLVRGVRNSSRLLMTYEAGGLVQLRVEDTIANEAPTQAAWSNSTETLNGGWPSYEFGDGSTGVSGILRKPSGEPSVRVFCRSIADTPNQFVVEFQDSLNQYQQDSYTLVDPDDVALCGQVVSTTLAAIGIPNFDQAGRMLKVNLDKSVQGNTYIEFETSVQAFGVRPGDLITVTYLKEGFQRQPFRILKIAPGMNNRITTITAQIHDDAWYADSNGQSTTGIGGTPQVNSGIGVPRPLVGSVVDANGDIQFGVAETSTMNSDGTVSVNLAVSFVPPATVVAAGPPVPLLSLAVQLSTGGTLTSGQTLYYAVSALDSAGDESPLSFVVMAQITAGQNSVTLTGLSFGSAVSGFNVYRGQTPAEMFRIATGQAVAAQFTDSGLAEQPIPPADPNYDHANFYWRMELQSEEGATVYSATTVGNGALQMAVNGYRGMTARITRGTGAGQEQTIAANTATTLTVAPAWTVPPDATSFFVVAEAGWHFGALAASSPADFEVPNQAGEVVEVTGRAANANNIECPAAISLVTRWQIGGGGSGDSAAPAQPTFAMGASPLGGAAQLSAVSFSDLSNTHSISSGTLTLHYWNELAGQPSVTLAAAVAATDQTLTLSAAGAATAGAFLQLDGEVMQVTAVGSNGLSYTVTRGMHGSAAAAHAAQAPIYTLTSATLIAPFPPQFFGTPYSGSWLFPIALPDVRVASAELYVTNDWGNSPTASICLTNNDDNGLRTLSGGQYTIQVGGCLAVDQSAAPPLVVEASHSVRDVFAVLGTAADAAVEVQLNVNGGTYCTTTIPAGQLVSTVVSGFTLPPLAAQSQITLSVVSVGQTYPGADLTVLIRL